MAYEELINRIIEETKPGDPPFTTQEAVDRWGYGKVHTREALNRMSTGFFGGVIRKDADAVPFLWHRVEGR